MVSYSEPCCADLEGKQLAAHIWGCTIKKKNKCCSGMDWATRIYLPTLLFLQAMIVPECSWKPEWKVEIQLHCKCLKRWWWLRLYLCQQLMLDSLTWCREGEQNRKKMTQEQDCPARNFRFITNGPSLTFLWVSLVWMYIWYVFTFLF